MSATTTSRILDSFDSVPHAMRNNALNAPQQEMLIYLNDDGTEQTRVTYLQLDTAACLIAMRLTESGLKPGDRAVIVCPPSIDFIIAFFGCLYAGVVAVPLYPPFRPSRLHKELPRFQLVFDDCAADLVLSTSLVIKMFELQSVMPFASRLHGSRGNALKWVSVSDVSRSLSGLSSCRPHSLDFLTRKSPAFIQYSSGSTGTPKGVVLNHDNLIANVEYLLYETFQHEDFKVHEVVVSWLPPYHDMGLIGTIITPVVVRGAVSVQMSPFAFLKDPAVWLTTMSKYRATITVAPNFALSYVVGRCPAAKARALGVNLEALNVVLCGAEPVQHATIQRFSKEYVAVQMSPDVVCPCYGLAEATLAVSARRVVEPYLSIFVDGDALSHNRVKVCDESTAGAVRLVSCGPPFERVAIVDRETKVATASDQIGEIWLSARVVSEGYWRKQEINDECFRAETVPSDGFRYLRTGDLGFLYKNELFITGRIKDVIISRGRNLYPQDIEHAAELATDDLRKGSSVAFAVESEGETYICLAIEVKDEAAARAASIASVVQQAVLDTCRTPLAAVLLLRARSIPKTTSGKVQRFECKRLALRISAAERGLEIVYRQVFSSEVDPLLAVCPSSTKKSVSGRIQELKLSVTTAIFMAMLAIVALLHKLSDFVRTYSMPRKSQSLELSSASTAVVSPALPSPSDSGSLPSQIALSLIDMPSPPSVLPSWLSSVPLCIHHLRSLLVSELSTEARLLSVRDIDPDTPFTSYGVDSARAIAAMGVLSRDIACDLPVTLLYDCPTLRSLAEHLHLWAHAAPTVRESLLNSSTSQLPRQDKYAIVGIGCRLPGDVSSPSLLWELLSGDRDAVIPLPTQRASSMDGRLDPRLTHGGWLSAIDSFDAPFFHISAREAACMDPQQRLALEVAWHALEDAAIPCGQTAQRAGVFVGASNSDYAHLLFAKNSSSAIDDVYTATGAAMSALSGRLSYFLNFTGPSMVVDTACSSGLVAVHSACQAIRNDECEFALAGGVNIISSLRVSATLSGAGFLSADGRCKSFDAKADGYGRGEGVGFVVLKSLAAAQRDSDRIYAVIEGSAVNQDGRSNGLTAPSTIAQAACIQDALSAAHVRPSQLSFVESHGTGTALGDPIELRALCCVLETDPPRVPVVIGAVKSNIGHLESAAGIAGLIKASLCLYHRSLPRLLHLHTPNPNLPKSKHFVLPTSSVALSETDRVYGGVSSFGFTGTNAHVVLSSAPAAEATAPVTIAVSHNVVVPLILSASSSSALKDLILRYRALLSSVPLAHIASIVSAAFYKRALLKWRVVLPISLVADLSLTSAEYVLLGSLGSFLSRITSKHPVSGSNDVIAVFSGQGRAYSHSIALTLLENSVFCDSLMQCDRIFGRFDNSWSLMAAMREGTVSSYQLPFALFAYQVASVALMASIGVRPRCVVGHSVGEIAAAVISNHISLEYGCLLIYARTKALQALAGTGSMLAVKASVDVVQQRLVPGVEVSVINSASNVVVSGSRESLAAFSSVLSRDNILHRAVEGVDIAYHSSAVDAVRDVFLSTVSQHLSTISHETNSYEGLSFYSSTLGDLVPADTKFDSEFWYSNIRNCVSFAGALSSALSSHPNCVVVELNFGPLMRSSVAETSSSLQLSAEHVPFPLSFTSNSVQLVLVEFLGALFVNGVDVNWSLYLPAANHRAFYDSLPLYPFQRAAFTASPLPVSVYPSVQSICEWKLPLPTRAVDSGNVLSSLNELSISFAWTALESLLGQPLTKFRLSDIPFAVSHTRLVRRILWWMCEAGVLVRNEDETFSVMKQPKSGSLVACPDPAYKSLFALMDKCGPHLSSILTGKQDALQVLFDGGAADAVASVYSDSPIAVLHNTLVAAVTSRLCNEQKHATIVEIGAGTGSTATVLLPLLNSRTTSYLFTDISVSLLAAAREKFAAFPFVSFDILNVESSTETYGAAFADVVIAANVLHATADLPQALHNARKLLKPGGYLILLEITSPVMFLDLTFGLTDGWWRYKDTVRSLSPLLSQQQWIDVITECGFVDAAVLPHTSSVNIEPFLSVIVASAPSTGDAATIERLPLALRQTQRSSVPQVPAPSSSILDEQLVSEFERLLLENTSEAEKLLSDVVIKHISRALLSYGDSQVVIDKHTHILEAGADSLLLIGLRQSLCAQLSVEIPVPLLAQNPTPDNIARVTVECCLQRGIITPQTPISVQPEPALRPPPPATRPRLAPTTAFSVPHIVGLGTAVPSFSDSQSNMAENFLQIMERRENLAGVAAADRIRRIFQHAAIEKRYSVLPDISGDATTAKLWARATNAEDNEAAMDERNALFVEEAPKLAVDACRAAIADWGGDIHSITHVISVSSTGTAIPGIELRVIQSLGLSPSTQRFGLNFLGCFGGLAALRTAQTIARTGGRVLLVCVELCTLHFRMSPRSDNVVASAIFADGAAAAIVGCDLRAGERSVFEVYESQCVCVPGTMDCMKWDMTNYGWEVGLDIDIPRHIKEHTPAFVQTLLDSCSDDVRLPSAVQDFDFAVHPGGRSILECIQESCQVSTSHMSHSYNVLSQYGNMSSATILFVLDSLRRDTQRREWAVALAFGPGLAIEGCLLRSPTIPR